MLKVMNTTKIMTGNIISMKKLSIHFSGKTFGK